jgi:hypothetical protein
LAGDQTLLVAVAASVAVAMTTGNVVAVGKEKPRDLDHERSHNTAEERLVAVEIYYTDSDDVDDDC